MLSFLPSQKLEKVLYGFLMLHPLISCFAPQLKVAWPTTPFNLLWVTYDVLAIKPNAQFSNLIYLGLSGVFDC